MSDETLAHILQHVLAKLPGMEQKLRDASLLNFLLHGEIEHGKFSPKQLIDGKRWEKFVQLDPSMKRYPSRIKRWREGDFSEELFQAFGVMK